MLKMKKWMSWAENARLENAGGRQIKYTESEISTCGVRDGDTESSFTDYVSFIWTRLSRWIKMSGVVDSAISRLSNEVQPKYNHTHYGWASMYTRFHVKCNSWTRPTTFIQQLRWKIECHLNEVLQHSETHKMLITEKWKRDETDII